MAKLIYRLSGKLSYLVSSMKTPNDLQTSFTTKSPYKKYHSPYCLDTLFIMTILVIRFTMFSP